MNAGFYPICWLDVDLIITHDEIQRGKVSGLRQLFPHLVDSSKMERVLLGIGVHVAIIDAHALSAIFCYQYCLRGLGTIA